MKFKFLFLALLLAGTNLLLAQPFSPADSLKGGLTPERTWWDLTFYHLNVEVLPATKQLRGTNLVRFTALQDGQRMQIDLQAPMQLTKAVHEGKELAITRVGNAHFLDFKVAVLKGSSQAVTLSFEGSPIEAKNPPWDGGLTWQTDQNGQPFIANANQGIGASVWWPCKDHPADEVDSMAISVTVPKGLMDVSNGRLVATDELPDGRTTFHWRVDNPINSYGVNLSVGDYVSWEETYAGENGDLNLAYFVLRDNKKAAKKQFKQAPKMIEAFEHWFGPYPFYEDGFKLIEVPYLGMEHQSAVTYGNGFANGYRGTDLSGTGEGLKFDFIIIHEAGHEWFANNITNADVADMWIHEGFTAYSENLYLDYFFGKESSSRYVRGTRRRIQNDRPIQNINRGVDARGSGDMYYKGSNLLHTLRAAIGNDEKWRTTLRNLNAHFRHQTVSSDQLVAFMAQELKDIRMNVPAFFAQYTLTTIIPTLEYRFTKTGLSYRWVNVVDGFNLPVLVQIDGQAPRYLFASQNWEEVELTYATPSLEILPDFYVGAMNTTVR